MDAIQVVTEPHRREILRLLWEEERSAGYLAEQFDLSFGAVSQHLARLREAGYVTVRSDGNRRIYRADRDRLAPYVPMLQAMWAAMLEGLVEAVEAVEAEDG